MARILLALPCCALLLISSVGAVDRWTNCYPDDTTPKLLEIGVAVGTKLLKDDFSGDVEEATRWSFHCRECVAVCVCVRACVCMCTCVCMCMDDARVFAGVPHTKLSDIRSLCAGQTRWWPAPRPSSSRR